MVMVVVVIIEGWTEWNGVSYEREREMKEG